MLLIKHVIIILHVILFFARIKHIILLIFFTVLLSQMTLLRIQRDIDIDPPTCETRAAVSWCWMLITWLLYKRINNDQMNEWLTAFYVAGFFLFFSISVFCFNAKQAKNVGGSTNSDPSITNPHIWGNTHPQNGSLPPRNHYTPCPVFLCVHYFLLCQCARKFIHSCRT